LGVPALDKCGAWMPGLAPRFGQAVRTFLVDAPGDFTSGVDIEYFLCAGCDYKKVSRELALSQKPCSCCCKLWAHLRRRRLLARLFNRHGSNHGRASLPLAVFWLGTCCPLDASQLSAAKRATVQQFWITSTLGAIWAHCRERSSRIHRSACRHCPLTKESPTASPSPWPRWLAPTYEPSVSSGPPPVLGYCSTR